MRALLAGAAVGLAAVAAAAQDAPGSVARLPAPRPHWVWVANPLLERAALVDLDDGRFLGQIDSGYGTMTLAFATRRPEVYVSSTYYSRRTRGERTDTVSIWDLPTLSPVAEVEIPPRRANDAIAAAHVALSDDERFLAVLNLTPATSLSIVDVERRRLGGEIAIPGCALVYAAGPRRFLSLCGNGALLVVDVDDQGREVAKTRTKPFFDPRADPVMEKAVRRGNEWLFVSFEGKVYPVDASGAEPRFGEAWSLFDERDRSESWRVGGTQPLALHAASGRLYALVHRGGRDSHKEPGEEVWVYDLESRTRRQRIELQHPGFTYLGWAVEPGRNWIWPFDGLWDWTLAHVVPAMVGQIQVTQDSAPLLFTAAQMSGALGVYDASSGELLRRVLPVGLATAELWAPWGGGAAP
jgi:methylamine dehydrogenase heavy chain